LGKGAIMPLRVLVTLDRVDALPLSLCVDGSEQPDLRSVRSRPAKRSCLVWKSFGAASKYGADLRLDTKVDQGRMNPTVGLDQPAANSASHSFPYGATLERVGPCLHRFRAADGVQVS
jgi:hypothetical protein